MKKFIEISKFSRYIASGYPTITKKHIRQTVRKALFNHLNVFY